MNCTQFKLAALDANSCVHVPQVTRGVMGDGSAEKNCHAHPEGVPENRNFGPTSLGRW